MKIQKVYFGGEELNDNQIADRIAGMRLGFSAELWLTPKQIESLKQSRTANRVLPDQYGTQPTEAFGYPIRLIE